MSAPVVQCPECGKNTVYDKCAVCGSETDGAKSFSERKSFALEGTAEAPPEVVGKVIQQITIRRREARRLRHGSVQHTRPQRRS